MTKQPNVSVFKEMAMRLNFKNNYLCTVKHKEKASETDNRLSLIYLLVSSVVISPGAEMISLITKMGTR